MTNSTTATKKPVIRKKLPVFLPYMDRDQPAYAVRMFGYCAPVQYSGAYTGMGYHFLGGAQQLVDILLPLAPSRHGIAITGTQLLEELNALPAAYSDRNVSVYIPLTATHEGEVHVQRACAPEGAAGYLVRISTNKHNNKTAPLFLLEGMDTAVLQRTLQEEGFCRDLIEDPLRRHMQALPVERRVALKVDARAVDMHHVLSSLPLGWRPTNYLLELLQHPGQFQDRLLSVKKIALATHVTNPSLCLWLAPGGSSYWHFVGLTTLSFATDSRLLQFEIFRDRLDGHPVPLQVDAYADELVRHYVGLRTP